MFTEQGCIKTMFVSKSVVNAVVHVYRARMSSDNVCVYMSSSCLQSKAVLR